MEDEIRPNGFCTLAGELEGLRRRAIRVSPNLDPEFGVAQQDRVDRIQPFLAGRSQTSGSRFEAGGWAGEDSVNSLLDR